MSKQNDKTSSTEVTTTPLQPAQPQTAAPNNNNNYNGISSDTSFWSSLFSFGGRNRRTRYWLTAICTNLLFLPANLSGDDMPGGVTIFTLLIFLPAMWVLPANIAKRCHDLGKSGFFGLLLIIPLVNIAIGIYLDFSKVI